MAILQEHSFALKVIGRIYTIDRWIYTKFVWFSFSPIMIMIPAILHDFDTNCMILICADHDLWIPYIFLVRFRYTFNCN